jgi:hypothetical protein
MNNSTELERVEERTALAAQLHEIELELANLVKEYGLKSEDSVPLSGLYIIVAAASRLMALTVTHEPVTSVILMKDLVQAAHGIHDDTVTALQYAVDRMKGSEELSGSSLGDILGQSLWSAGEGE